MKYIFKIFVIYIIAQAAKNHTAIIELLVEDVEKEYSRLASFLEPYIVQKRR